MERYTVDKISDGLVTLLLRRDEDIQIVVPATDLPGVSEGDILQIDFKDENVVEFFVEEELTASKRQTIQEKLRKIQQKNR